MTQKMTEILSEEHQNILKVTDALTKECNAIESGKDIDKDFFTKAIDFIRNYADQFHHAKEEEILFKEFTKNEECLHCNPVPQMLHEHDEGRAYVRNLESHLQKNNKAGVVQNGLGYAMLLEQHIFKEDNILYPMINETLDEEAQKSVLKRAEEAERKKFAKGTKEKYLAIAEELSKRN